VTRVMIKRDLLVAYLRLLKHGDVGVREFQRIMNYRSPGKAKTVLEKLVRTGLVEKIEGSTYRAKRELPFLLSTYIVLKSMLLLKSLPITLFTLSFTITYILLSKPPLETIIAFAIIVLPHFLETLYAYQQLRKYIRS